MGVSRSIDIPPQSIAFQRRHARVVVCVPLVQAIVGYYFDCRYSPFSFASDADHRVLVSFRVGVGQL